jgi:hypothetical protein
MPVHGLNIPVGEGVIEKEIAMRKKNAQEGKKPQGIQVFEIWFIKWSLQNVGFSDQVNVWVCFSIGARANILI